MFRKTIYFLLAGTLFILVDLPNSYAAEKYVGIGIGKLVKITEFTEMGEYEDPYVTDGFVEVREILLNSPAEKSGLMVGYLITKINGNKIYKMTAQEIANALRGPEGTEIILFGYRPLKKDWLGRIIESGWMFGIEQEFKIKRQKIIKED